MTNSNIGRNHNFAATYNPSYSQLPSIAPSTQQLDTQPPPPKKAKHRRKRHVPPGPAGLWYQSQLHKTISAPRNDNNNSNNNNSNRNRNTDAEQHDSDSEQASTDISSSPAWMCMQLAANLLTPYLPPYYTAKQRYHVLRTLVPDEYTFLEEVQRPDHDLKISRKIIVLVHAIQCHSYCDWTVELRDECGSSIKAWCSPTLVKEEQEKPNLLRPGVVWCLQNVTIVPSFEGELWLLLNQDSFQSMWIAETVSDKAYLEWMGKREQIPFEEKDLDPIQQEDNASKEESSRQDSSQSEEEEEEEEEEEKEEEDHDDGGRALRRRMLPQSPPMIQDVTTEIGLPNIDLHPPAFVSPRVPAIFNEEVFPDIHLPNIDFHPPQFSSNQVITNSSSSKEDQNPTQINPVQACNQRQNQQVPVPSQAKKPPSFSEFAISQANPKTSSPYLSKKHQDLRVTSQPPNIPARDPVPVTKPTPKPIHEAPGTAAPKTTDDFGALSAAPPKPPATNDLPVKPKASAKRKKKRPERSKLWAMDHSIMGMFDEDEENEPPVTFVEESKIVDKDSPKECMLPGNDEESRQPETKEQLQHPTVFARSFIFDTTKCGGIDMDDLFDED